jgi:hypothetical protein
MSRRSILLICALLALPVDGDLHAEPEARTEVLILGVYHFDNPGLDDHNLDVDDYLTSTRQAEIDVVNDRLEAFAPDRIFIEQNASSQARIDSLYAAYVDGSLDLATLDRARSEIYQLGFKLGKRLGHERVFCVGARNIWFSGHVRAIADSLGIDAIHRYDAADEEREDGQAYIRTHTVLENLIRTNRPEDVLRNHRFYVEALPYVLDPGLSEAYEIIQVEKDDAAYSALAIEDRYIGAELTAEWYRANLKIFANILHHTRPDDARVLVIYGQGHKRILEHLFEDHSGFVLTSANDVLGSD